MEEVKAETASRNLKDKGRGAEPTLHGIDGHLRSIYKIPSKDEIDSWPVCVRT